jgi:hypothetical protein
VDTLAHGATREGSLGAIAGFVNAAKDGLAAPLDLAVAHRSAAAHARVFVARRRVVAAPVFTPLERMALARGATPDDARHEGCDHRPEEARSTHLFPRSFSLHRLALMEHGAQAEPP